MNDEWCRRAGKVKRGKVEAAEYAAFHGYRAYRCEFCSDWHITSKEKRATHKKEEPLNQISELDNG